MLRRKPTRIELKLDNIGEWTTLRKEKEKGSSSSDNIPCIASEGPYSPTIQESRKKRDFINARIGFEGGRQTVQADISFTRNGRLN